MATTTTKVSKKAATKKATVKKAAPKKLAAVVEEPVINHVPVTDAQYAESCANWYGKKPYMKTVEIPGAIHKPMLCITTTGMTTGCGLLQIQGVSQVKDENYFKALVQIIGDIREDALNPRTGNRKAGAMITTLGDAHRGSCEAWLLKAGFTPLSTYNNWQHGLTYKQTLYIYLIK